MNGEIKILELGVIVLMFLFLFCFFVFFSSSVGQSVPRLVYIDNLSPLNLFICLGFSFCVCSHVYSACIILKNIESFL